MRKTFAAAILSSAVLAGIGLLSPTLSLSQAAPKADMDNQQTQIPVKQVVLYSSGVGYFEHFGTVKGNGNTELHFKAAQINDILKSLILQDMDKGRVGVITYPSQDPIAKTLRSFQVDITANPSMAELLNQLRGAKVTLGGGVEKISGTVLGVENKSRPLGSGEGAKVVQVPFLNLITESGIRSVQLDEVRSLVLEEKKLQDELTRALAALAGARDQDKKPVNISLQGDGERRIRIGYVVETPVWKTSYRLLLTEKGGDKPAEKPDVNLGGKPNPAGAAAQADTKGALQGWAIVENQTDNDWTDVQLSLVSGRPISFVQDLYQPLYVPRPVVQPELYASLRPQTYDAAMGGAMQRERFAATEEKGAGMNQLARRRAVAAAPPAPMAPGAMPMAKAAADRDSLNEPMDAGASVSSIASASKVGELFQYTVGSVTLPRQTSAMIPVVTDPVEVEKLSIYNLSVLPKNPLLGARVKNTTGKHLLQGPVTVLDGGAYAGDARIDDLPPGQERLISYGVDQQILVQAKNNQQHSTLTTGKIVNGTLRLTFKEIISQDYIAENKGDHDKTLVIEHARLGNQWKLTEPAKADETTDALYRFKGQVKAGKGTQLTVKQEWVRGERIDILPLDLGSTLTYSQTSEIPDDVRKALTKAAELKQTLAGTEQEINDRQNRISQISTEQQRLRENMKTVAQNTEYYTRLLKKLDDQESQIESLQKEVVTLRGKAEKQRKALSDYVNGLNVG